MFCFETCRKTYSQSISNDVRKYTDAMIVPKRVPGLGAGALSAGGAAAKINHGGVSWEEYLGELLPGVCAGLGEEFGYGEDDASCCHSAMRSPRSSSTTPHTVRSTLGTARRTPVTPTPATPSPVPSSSTPVLDVGDALTANTSSKATDARGVHPKSKSTKASSSSLNVKLPLTSPGPGTNSTNSTPKSHHRSNTANSNDQTQTMQTLSATSVPAVPALPLLKTSSTATATTATATTARKTRKTLSKRENMMLHVFAQAAKQFQA